ncbi:sensor histidine kinase [Sedimenticola selenatireducens]|uniref:histidine kinase n=1 Tax=Sedimenticola selenatireducens TaxID=191960 RepID=A0A557RV19_9GAMM|nr:HAMP domain-containing sensor histidine kinase [Sedimenticola selenatireducens]TVO69000.1 HAMP domain-containing histidine kinase [Sedimenticola selenatireducens]TVT60884.1 MAG: HAMP domain-containing histidine kinase [Sedimenticola selenatireducens]
MDLGSRLTGLNKSQLRRWMLLFFLALLIPSGVLIQQSYSQLKWEAFHRYRVQAEELTGRINNQLNKLVDSETLRSFTDYSFLVVAGDTTANFLQRSALSAFPINSDIPGMIGYFQVDDQGSLTTPLLPAQLKQADRYGIAAEELMARQSLQSRMQQILSQNRLVVGGTPGRLMATPEIKSKPIRPDTSVSLESAAPAELANKLELRALKDVVPEHEVEGYAKQEARAPTLQGQAAFDQLNRADVQRQPAKKQILSKSIGRVEDLKLDKRYEAKLAEEQAITALKEKLSQQEQSAIRRERSVMPAPSAVVEQDEAVADSSAMVQSGVRINTFESEIDAFEFSLLDSGHFVLFRKVWRDGRRYIQGMLIEQGPFLESLIAGSFSETALSEMSELLVAYRGELIRTFGGKRSDRYYASVEELSGALLYRSSLSAPLNDLEVIYSISHLPAGPGGQIINWVAATLILIMCGGFYLMYRLGLRQIALARQQQDFVSAVSHELKTPLTSIRMYGEMLREGWASEEKKRVYYDYIHDESERLTRLINNVLQLARMTRHDLQLDCRPVTIAESMDGIRSKITSQVERAGFELNLNGDAANSDRQILLDGDSFSQIVINLVDNAIKFSAKSAIKRIDISATIARDSQVVFTVRDYGPGVPRDQMKKIFRLFYRTENELTRETIGTGIGLALVSQLTLAMKGRVDVINQQPGAAFRVSFPLLPPKDER